MKKRILSVLAVVLMIGSTFAQTDVSIGAYTDAVPGETIDIPVQTAGDLQDLGAIQFAIQFTNLDVYTGSPSIENRHATLSTGFTSNYDEPSNTLFISWTKANLNGPALSIPAGSKLFDIRISYVSGDSDIEFYGSENYILDASYPFTQLNLNLVNGNVMQKRFSVSGKLKYANTGTVRPISNSAVYLKSADGTTTLQTVTTDANGDYILEGILPGDYQVTASTTKPWGGVNAFDDIRFRSHINSQNPLADRFLLAADIDNNNSVNAFDGIRLKLRITIGSLNGWNRPSWNFDQIQISIQSADLSQDIIGICTGDINASYTPPTN